MKNYAIIYKHIISGIIARETGVDSTSWLIIEANHLSNDQQQPLNMTIPSFIFNSLDWEEIHIPYANLEYSNFVKEAFVKNSEIFQKNKDLFFLIL